MRPALSALAESSSALKRGGPAGSVRALSGSLRDLHRRCALQRPKGPPCPRAAAAACPHARARIGSNPPARIDLALTHNCLVRAQGHDGEDRPQDDRAHPRSPRRRGYHPQRGRGQVAGPLGRAPHQRARPRPGRAAVLQPHDVPVPLRRGAARRQHVRLHRQRHLRPLQAAAGLRRLRAHRLRRVRHPQRELRDQARHQSGHADPAEHRRTSAASSAASAACSTGATSSPPRIPGTTSGPSGSSCSSSRRGRRTRRPPRSTGARTTRPCWPTSRSSTAGASAATRWSSSARSSSGSSGSPSTPTGCWPISTTGRRWTGPTAPSPRSATGWGGQRARRSTSRSAAMPRATATRAGTPSGCSPPGPTPSSAPRSWCWRPSIRWWTGWSRRSNRGRSRRTGRPPRRRTWSPARSASARRPASSPAATPSTRPPPGRFPSGSPTTS